MTTTLDQIRHAGLRESIRDARRTVGIDAQNGAACAKDVALALERVLTMSASSATPAMPAWQSGDWRRLAVAMAEAEEAMSRLRNCLDHLRADVGRAARLEEKADCDDAA